MARKKKPVMGAEHLAEVADLLARKPAEVAILEKIQQRAVAIDGEAQVKAADALDELTVLGQLETLGDAMAAQDAVGADYLEEGRKLGIFPQAQGESESAADYDARCEAFKPDTARLGAFKRGFIKRAALRTTVPFSLFVENEATGLCRDAKPGDNPARVVTYSPLDCYLMSSDDFKGLAGKASDEATVKGRVSGSRQALQNIGDVRANRAKADAREEGRRLEAATGAKGRGARGGNKTLAQDAAAFAKKGATKAAVFGTDKGQAFKAAFAAFMENIIARGVVSQEDWDAARKG